MKVLLITDMYEDFVGGIITLIAGIEKVLTEEGHQYKVIHPNMFKTTLFKEFNNLVIATDPWNIKGHIESYKPDLMLVCGEGFLSVAAGNYCRYNNLPFLTFYQTKIPEFSEVHFKIPKNVSYKYLEWYHARATKVLSISKSMTEQLTQNTSLNNVKDWFGGVDTERFNPSKKDLMSQYNSDFDSWPKPILLCVCRASWEKNIDQFLACNVAGTKVYIGDGPALVELKSKFPDVKYLGFKHGDELAAYYAAADCFVFPSKGDAFGMVIIEALASGTPVAGANATGTKDILEVGVNGYLAHDENDFENTITKALALDRNAVYASSAKWSVNSSVKVIIDSGELISTKTWNQIENPSISMLLANFQSIISLFVASLDYFIASLLYSRMNVPNIMVAWYCLIYFLVTDSFKLVKSKRS